MNKEILIEKVIQAGYATAIVQEHILPAKNNAPATRKEFWLIAEPHNLLDSEKKNFALVKVLQDVGVPYSEILTYAKSIIARDIRFGDSPTKN